MDIFGRIAVDFSKKAQAREMGVIFNKEDRCWYLPSSVDETQIERYTSLAFPVEKEDAHVLPVQGNPPEENPALASFSDLSEELWQKLIETRDGLRIALAVRDSGMPESSLQREAILRIFSTRKPGEYPIVYRSMVECSERFATMYDENRVIKLVRDHITGSRSYVEDIKDSNLSGEEKALLMFYLPMQL